MTRRIAVVACLMILSVLGTVSPAGAADARLYTVLTGAAERPGPGDPDAIGRAVITINDETNQLCLILQYVNVDGTISGLHIHLAPTTTSGPIRVPFSNPTQQVSGQFRECVTVGEALLDDIAANPGNYYLNLHSQPSFGPGAIRGQLRAI